MNATCIAVMRSGAVGDFVLTLPAIDALRNAFPGARLCLIGSPRIAILAHPDRIVDHDDPALAPLHVPRGDLSDETRDLLDGFDLLLAYAVDPDRILASRLRALVGGTVVMHDPRPLANSLRHITDHLLEPVRCLGISVSDPVPHIRLREEEETYAASCWKELHLPPPVAALHPGSGSPDKCWPAERFLKLADRLQRRGISVLFLKGPVEAEREELSRFSALHPPTLLDLAALLARADLFVGNDSGPGHIAAAVGTPTLTLFGPTDPRVWRPRTPRGHILQAPSGQLSLLGVDSVTEAAIAILRKEKAGKAHD